MSLYNNPLWRDRILFGCWIILHYFSDQPEDTDSNNVNYWGKSFRWKGNWESLCTPSLPTCPQCPGEARRERGRGWEVSEPSDGWHPQKYRCSLHGRGSGEQESTPMDVLLLLWRALGDWQAEYCIADCELESNTASVALFTQQHNCPAKWGE